jgi:transcriptional regulator with XRE-family HTH domain
VDLASSMRRRRRELGLTQTDLAVRADVSMSLISGMERRIITDPHYSTLSRIAVALGTSIGELVGETAPKAPAARPSIQRGYPYSWMAETLAEVIGRWQDKSLEPVDPKHSYIIANACLDIMRHILRYDVPGERVKDRVPKSELKERISLTHMLNKIAKRAHAHYVSSVEADDAEVKNLEERFENVVPLRGAG